MNSDNEPIHSITEKDFTFKYTRGSGAGGQKRNKTSSACHCSHPDSGARGYSDATRSQHKNKLDAWYKCVTSKRFKTWHRIEIAKVTGDAAKVDEKVDHEMMFNTRTEYRDEDGNWTTKVPGK